MPGVRMRPPVWCPMSCPPSDRVFHSPLGWNSLGVTGSTGIWERALSARPPPPSGRICCPRSFPRLDLPERQAAVQAQGWQLVDVPRPSWWGCSMPLPEQKFWAFPAAASPGTSQIFGFAGKIQPPYSYAPALAWSQCCQGQGTTARLAQSVERKALNLVVVGSSPTVGAQDRHLARGVHFIGGPGSGAFLRCPGCKQERGRSGAAPI